MRFPGCYPTEEYKLIFKSKEEVLFVPVSDIVFLESKGYIINVKTCRPQPISLTGYSLVNLEIELQPYGFFKINKRTIVNLSRTHILTVEDNSWRICVEKKWMNLSRHKAIAFLELVAKRSFVAHKKAIFTGATALAHSCLPDTKNKKDLTKGHYKREWLNEIVNDTNQNFHVLLSCWEKRLSIIDLKTVTYIELVEQQIIIYMENRLSEQSEIPWDTYCTELFAFGFRKISETLLINLKYLVSYRIIRNFWLLNFPGLDEIKISRRRVTQLEKNSPKDCTKTLQNKVILPKNKVISFLQKNFSSNIFTKNAPET
ncbi:MAG: LytTR family transcriptional regulator [Bacteroidales bacterium]|jgi:DNA-binding LytR/AlgR family response regulator|nr:LytTR family transcriptional regulator [Bacteroidales bacterium]